MSPHLKPSSNKIEQCCETLFSPKAIKHAARFQRSPDANALIYKWALTQRASPKTAGAEKMLSPFKSGGLRKNEYAKDVLFR
jgi:hypothetical protein